MTLGELNDVVAGQRSSYQLVFRLLRPDGPPIILDYAGHTKESKCVIIELCVDSEEEDC